MTHSKTFEFVEKKRTTHCNTTMDPIGGADGLYRFEQNKCTVPVGNCCCRSTDPRPNPITGQRSRQASPWTGQQPLTWS